MRWGKDFVREYCINALYNLIIRGYIYPIYPLTFHMANIFTLLINFSLEFTGLERGSNQKKS